MAKIEDFGEKIGGARKDLYGLNRELRLKDIVDWSDIDRDKYITKKETFPLPDYKKLYEQGMDREVLFFIKQVRDSLPTKPSPVIGRNMTEEEKQAAIHQAQDDYIQTMGRFYDKAIHLTSLTECAEYLNSLRAEMLPDKSCFSRKLYNVASINDSYTMNRFRNKLKKKKFLYSEDEKALLEYEIFAYNGSNVEVDMDVKNNPMIEIKQGKATYFVFRNSPEILDLGNWKENTYFVMDKNAHTIVTINEPDRSSAEQAAIALYKQKDVTVKEQKKRKQKLIPAQLEKIHPTQEAYRNGKHITGDDMMEIFGFRAGEFGNWENDNDRQTNLDMSYDALKDLAKALNISEQDISLGGKLAIAYGARGISGALAHFEPGTNVINLTKMRGAGSLAHEWGHALDYYIAQTTGNGEIFATDTWDGKSYMHEVMQAIHYRDGQQTEYYKNAVMIDNNYSKAGQGYWQSDVELFARAFASYVRDKLSGDSDYLVGHSEMMAPIIEGGKQQWFYTSPQGEERKRINQAIDKMINAVKEQGLLHQGKNKDITNQNIEKNQNEKTFAEQVDDVLNGKFPVYSNLKVCNTPQILLKVGCDSLPMLYTQKHLKDAIAPIDSKEHKHGLRIEQIKKLPQLIEKPAMIFDSPIREDSLIAVTTEFDSNDNPVMVSIKLNGQGRYELTNVESNFITSVYGRNNFGAYFQKIIDLNNLLFCDKEKSQKIFERWGEQYSEITNTFDFDTILHPSKNIVKKKIENLNNYAGVIKPASTKQKKYAQKIAQTLDVDLPQNDTKQAYMEFIKEHVEEYNQNRKVPVHYTEDQIARANAVDIVEYAKSQGLELKRVGRDYRVRNYSGGFLITPEKNNWNWFAENKGGGVVQLCMELENKNWQDAIGTLIQEDMVAIQRTVPEKKEPEKPKEFHLPERNNTTKHVYAYLTKTRKIDPDIVKQMFGRKLLYENVQRSCVFVGYDKEGIARHASVRSTNTSGNVYKKDVSGSQKKYSFSITGNTNVLNVLEAPIDVMSYMSLQKMNGRALQDSYVALGGVSTTALDQYLKEHPEIRVIRICTDNDEAGQRAAQHIAEKYGEHYKVTRHTPKAKDFNEDLIAYCESIQLQKPAEREEQATYSNPSVEKYHGLVEQHKQLIQDKKKTYQNRTTVVINAFGGAGAGKTVACMDVCQQLKKRGYNAEYVSEYCKELVYENSDLLSGMPDNQFEILKEQMKRMDRMVGQVDFIVTDSPILLNSIYNKELTQEYAQMVQELFHDYDNFTFFVERDVSHYQIEGRIHTLSESIEKDSQIKQMLADNNIYYGTYNHNSIDKIVENAEKTFQRLQKREGQSLYTGIQEVAVTGEKEEQSIDIKERMRCLSILDTDIVNIGLHFFHKDVRPMLLPVVKHSTAVV